MIQALETAIRDRMAGSMALRNLLASQTPAEDETGATWGPAKHGLSLANSAAFLRVQGVDLSPFAGVEGSSTPYVIDLKDANGKEATGFIGAADAAETLGDEEVTNGEFSSDTSAWSGTNCTLASVGGGQAGNCLEITRTGGSYQQARQTCSLTVGKLYEISAYVKSGTSGNETYVVGVWGSATDFNVYLTGTSSGTWAQRTGYFVAEETSLMVCLRKTTTTEGTMLFDTVTLKEVAHVGTDGVHIVSAENGATRNWQSVESGFEYNGSSYTFDIYALSSAPAYNFIAPAGAALDYVVFDVTYSDLNDTPVRAQDCVLTVKAVSETSLDAAGSIDYQVDQLFHDKELTVTGWANYWLMRRRGWSFAEPSPAGRVIWYAGGEYDVRLEES